MAPSLRQVARRLGALAAALAAIGAEGASPPRAPAIGVVRSAHVSADAPAVRHVESVLAVNPRDPRNLVAAAIALGADGGVAVYASLDGGRSWVRGGPASGAAPFFDGIDPAVTFDRDGNAYLLADGEELAAWKSTDGGLTWGGRAVVPGSAWDRPWIVYEAGASEALRSRLHVAGKMSVTVFGHLASDIAAVCSSKDRGATFSFPKLLLPAPERTLLNCVSDLVAAPDGRLILTLETYGIQDLHSPLLAGSHQTIASSDGGRTFTEPRPGPPFRAFGHAREGKSLFGLGGAKMAVDTSSARRGRLYLTWLDDRLAARRRAL